MTVFACTGCGSTMTDAELLDVWRLMDTAPKDGTNCLIYRKYPTGYEIMTVAHYSAAKDNWEQDVGLYDIAPSHWRPLPQAPEESEDAI